MMKHIKTVLRLWIASTSVFGFMAGWVLFAHAGKPAPATVDQKAATVEVAPLPTLAPLPGLDDPISNIQPLPVMPQPQRLAPRMRTGGS